ncbi:6-phosphofructokinase [Candidatus Woesearchaeota archaeon]|nr:6-phosphofructokinase [Candidatus Woesearchaeota archaeon]
MGKGRVGVVPLGGDTSTINSICMGIALAAQEQGVEAVAFRQGWLGVLEPDENYKIVVPPNGQTKPTYVKASGEYTPLIPNLIDPDQGGTPLLMKKVNPLSLSGAPEDITNRLKRMGIHEVVAIGADDTIEILMNMKSLGYFWDIRFVVATKTIDNDVGTNGSFLDMFNFFTSGFPTAVSKGVSYGEGAYSNVFTNNKVMVYEVMGRKTGWLALTIGELVGAHMVLIPEDPIFIDDICKRIFAIYKQQQHAFVVVAEGVIDAKTGEPLSADKSRRDPSNNAKLGGAGHVLARHVYNYFSSQGCRLDYCDFMTAGYALRGGQPTPLDRVTAQALGHHALEQLLSANLPFQVAGLVWDGTRVVPAVRNVNEVVAFDGREVIPRNVPIDGVIPENGLYDKETKLPTKLAGKYADLLGVPRMVLINGWQGPIYR